MMVASAVLTLILCPLARVVLFSVANRVVVDSTLGATIRGPF